MIVLILVCFALMLVILSSSASGGVAYYVSQHEDNENQNNDAAKDRSDLKPSDNQCPAYGEFPATLVGQLASAKCPVGYTGTRTALCKEDKTFDTPDVSQCTSDITRCAANDIFSGAAVGSYGNAVCPIGYTGNQKAICLPTGQFAEPDRTQCVKITKCIAASGFPDSVVGAKVTIPCPSNYTGNKTAVCNIDGTFAIDSTACVPITKCPEADGFASVNVGQKASKNCAAGYRGSQTAMCLSTGTYGPPDQTGCVVNSCLPVDGFPMTDYNKTATAPCGGSQIGNKTALCQTNGQFATADYSDCAFSSSAIPMMKVRI